MEMGLDHFLAEVFSAVQGFGGLSWGGKIIVIITLLISSMKVSLLRSYVWDRLGPAKVLLAPALGLVAGLMSLDDKSLPALTAYVMAGAGAILLHQLLDALKETPYIGEKYLWLVDGAKKLLKGKPQS
jgi:hypothetical protein